MQNVLLVEDNMADVRLFQEYLRDLRPSYSISSTDSLEKARCLDQTLSSKVVVVDLSLPDTAGEETVTLATQYFHDKPIIILTGLDDLSLAKKSVMNGVQDYLVKGEINQTSLRRSLQHAIERHKLLLESQRQQQSLMQHNEHLQQTNERLQQFTHMLSHDIRGPIANILGLVQLSEMQQAKAVSYTPEVELIDRIKTTARTLDRHLNDILSLLHEQNSWVIQSSLQSWDNIAEEIRILLNEKIQTSKAKITTDFAAPTIFYPPSVLKSIMMNLLSNAIKYREVNRPLSVHIATQQLSDGTYTLTVSDNGMGIDLKNHREKLFMPFRRFHPHIEGKGVGLYLIRKIVEDLGGEVSVESQIGKGTTFNFLLHDVQLDEEAA
ncbi:hybrid sensor histidine kinase/response regulator [Tunicatimonas pelagia]|uniref:hybrid sensor histidine kinase/response regulator n=1 Tax=Tunicatimonas pelagia TaxID=931531 RepID=UPI0026650923|nr:hybrid sensor histidine kinase/response regulator [Tunicatimonas pelagia]WKN44587.1 ATP-binding protein [Tunicatimonas pelagia]